MMGRVPPSQDAVLGVTVFPSARHPLTHLPGVAATSEGADGTWSREKPRATAGF